MFCSFLSSSSAVTLNMSSLCFVLVVFDVRKSIFCAYEDCYLLPVYAMGIPVTFVSESRWSS